MSFLPAVQPSPRIRRQLDAVIPDSQVKPNYDPTQRAPQRHVAEQSLEWKQKLKDEDERTAKEDADKKERQHRRQVELASALQVQLQHVAMAKQQMRREQEDDKAKMLRAHKRLLDDQDAEKADKRQKRLELNEARVADSQTFNELSVGGASAAVRRRKSEARQRKEITNAFEAESQLEQEKKLDARQALREMRDKQLAEVRARRQEEKTLQQKELEDLLYQQQQEDRHWDELNSARAARLKLAAEVRATAQEQVRSRMLQDSNACQKSPLQRRMSTRPNPLTDRVEPAITPRERQAQYRKELDAQIQAKQRALVEARY